MSIFSALKPLKAWTRPDYSDPRQRFIRVDGSPYDGAPDGAPDEARTILRAFRTPMFKATAIAGLFVAATTALFVPPKDRQWVLLALCAAFPYFQTLAHREWSKERQQIRSDLKNIVIDKTGRALPNPKAFAAVQSYYHAQVVVGGRELVAASAMTACLFPPLFAAIAGEPALGLPFAALGVAPYASRHGWALYARHQLHHSDKPWTVTDNPPPLRKTATEPKGALLKAAAN
jgi:hypothetical protein